MTRPTDTSSSSGEPLLLRLSQLLYRCLEEIGSTKAALYLLDPVEGGFALASHYGWPRTQPPPETLPPGDPLLQLVVRERRPFVVNDARHFPELQPFALGAVEPRFLVSPIYDKGHWVGLLLQRDLPRSAPYALERQEAPTQTICQEVVLARNAFPRQAEPPPPVQVPKEMPVTPREEIPAIRVAAPASAALVGIEAEPPAELPDNQDPFLGLPQADPNAVVPEQQTFFWEAAQLLCQTVPAAAVALWLNDPLEPRPLLAYSRSPLSSDLKQQMLAQAAAQVPHLRDSGLKLLARAEWADRDPLAGHFMTLLPVLLEAEVDGPSLLMLFRLEDRPFTLHEQTLVRQISRMLGFYLQEVRLHERYHQAFLSVSHRILASAEGRLPAMRKHSVNTAELCRDLARALDLTSVEVEAVSISAILHDVGTLLLDHRILDKPNLTSEDMAHVRTHPLLASAFLKDLYFPFDVLRIIRHHHENWDGSGYPDGLAGEAIPIGSRIIRLVEAYEMMVSTTPYRPAKSEAAALHELEALAGAHFDPVLAPRFIELLKSRHQPAPGGTW